MRRKTGRRTYGVLGKKGAGKEGVRVRDLGKRESG